MSGRTRGTRRNGQIDSVGSLCLCFLFFACHITLCVLDQVKSLFLGQCIEIRLFSTANVARMATSKRLK